MVTYPAMGQSLRVELENCRVGLHNDYRLGVDAGHCDPWLLEFRPLSITARPTFDMSNFAHIISTSDFWMLQLSDNPRRSAATMPELLEGQGAPDRDGGPFQVPREAGMLL